MPFAKIEDAIAQIRAGRMVVVVDDDLAVDLDAGLVDLALLEAPDDVVLTPGGETRQDSVWNGLQQIDAETVVVHDAARPLVTADLVRSVLDALGDAKRRLGVTSAIDILRSPICEAPAHRHKTAGFDIFIQFRQRPHKS